MLAGIIFRREPFFRGDDNKDQLVKIARYGFFSVFPSILLLNNKTYS